MELKLITIPTLLLFLLMIIRIVGMFLAAPFFSANGMPAQVMALLAVVFALLLFPAYAHSAHLHVTNMWAFAWIAGQEFVIGALIGFAASLLFAGLQMAGNNLNMQMGMGMAQAVDPMTNQDAPVFSSMFSMLGIVLFLTLNLHHAIIIALARSFDQIPLASGFAHLNTLTARFISMSADMFSMSLMVILPIFVIMLMLEIVLAYTAKMMPHMNIFMVSLPLKIAAGLVLFYLTLPFIAETLGHAYADLVRHLYDLYQA